MLNAAASALKGPCLVKEGFLYLRPFLRDESLVREGFRFAMAIANNLADLWEPRKGKLPSLRASASRVRRAGSARPAKWTAEPQIV